MERSEAHETMNALIESIAEHLTGHWEFKPNPIDWNPGGHLTDADSGAILYLSRNTTYADRNKNLLHIGSDLPKDDKGKQAYVSGYYNKSLPSINVSLTKIPSQIAKAIESRLMPEYLPILAQAIENVRGQTEYHSKTETMAKKIAKLMDVPEKSIHKGTEVSFYHSPHAVFSERPLNEAKVSGDGVTLHLDLDYETTMKVLKHLISL